MITKRTKGYVSYLYTQIKYKSKLFNIKIKQGEVIKLVSKETLHFKYVPKE